MWQTEAGAPPGHPDASLRAPLGMIRALPKRRLDAACQRELARPDSGPARVGSVWVGDISSRSESAEALVDLQPYQRDLTGSRWQGFPQPFKPGHANNWKPIRKLVRKPPTASLSLQSPLSTWLATRNGSWLGLERRFGEALGRDGRPHPDWPLRHLRLMPCSAETADPKSGAEDKVREG